MHRGFIFALGMAALVIGAASAGPAAAQSWFTREACTVLKPAIDPRVIDATELAAIRAEAAAIPNGVGRFWRITSPAGSVSHLWGTLHSSHRLALALPEELTSALAAARVVALEMDTVKKSRAQVEAWSKGGDFYWSKPKALQFRSIDRRVLNWINARLVSRGYGDDSMAWMKPWALAENVLGDPCNDFTEGVIPIQDGRIQTLGTIAGARIVGLEAADSFKRRLKGPGGDELALAIIESYGALLGPSNIRAARRTVFAMYLQGRIAEMIVWDRRATAAFLGTERGRKSWAKMHGYLVDERNRGFVARARRLLDQGGAVIAVGSFHLPGEAGLVAKLRAAGYRVGRIRVKGEAASGG